MSDPAGNTEVAVVILGAGASTRMGKPKLLLPWGATSVLGHLLEQWRTQPISQLAVVVAAGDSLVPGELDRLGVPAGRRIVNPNPERGMFSSVQCAARWDGWNADLTHWVLALGDQPQVRAETLGALLEFGRTHPARICQPAWNGRPRHPVWMPRAVFGALAGAGAASLKQFLENRSTQRELCALADPGLDLDMDTPEDYARALRIGLPNQRQPS